MIEITAIPVTTQKLEPGEYYDYKEDDNWIMIKDTETKVLKENGEILCHYKPGAISKELCDLAIESYLDAGKMISSNRGIAAGMKHRERTQQTNYETGNKSNSNIIGYIDSPNHKKPCRLTMYSKKYFEKYTKGLPFIIEIDKLFKATLPEKYNIQNVATNLFKIPNTCFSTVTVNYNFRTALHKDAGDFKEGFGNMVVCKTDGFKGGFLLFPGYKVAIEMNNGDYIALDVHEYHCNSSFTVSDKDEFRLSFVCYLREKMVNCHKINKILENLQVNSDKNWNTDIIFDKIFKSIGENIPEKIKLNDNTRWWSMSAGRFVLTYKNKRYELFDKNVNKTIHNLMPAWEYANSIITSDF